MEISGYMMIDRCMTEDCCYLYDDGDDGAIYLIHSIILIGLAIIKSTGFPVPTSTQYTIAMIVP